MHEVSPPLTTAAKRRILILDDHPLVRRGLIALIDAEPDLIVCAEAATGRTALAAIAASKLDIIIADLSLRGEDGLDVVREIRSTYRHLPVLVLSMHEAPRYVRCAFAAGVSGYVSKQDMTETLLTAIRSVLSGIKYVSPSLSARCGNV